jgi:hypothetical protein
MDRSGLLRRLAAFLLTLFALQKADFGQVDCWEQEFIGTREILMISRTPMDRFTFCSFPFSFYELKIKINALFLYLFLFK